MRAGERSGAGAVRPADLARWNTRANRLRWILGQTMGAPEAFELRRRDLAAELGRPAREVTDEQIVESYLADMRATGLLREYLFQCVPIHREGNTLFAHGGVTDENVGAVPGEVEARRSGTVDEWVRRLAAWYRRELDRWRLATDAPVPGDAPPGQPLIDYAMRSPGRSVNQFSVAYGRNVDREGKVTLPSERVMGFLLANGISRLALGHTPSGDTPLIVRTGDDRFEVLVVDQSRAVRPEIAPLVTLDGPCGDSVTIRGSAPHPIGFRCWLGRRSPLGKRLADGSVVVAPLATGFLTYQVHPGFRVEYRVIDARESGYRGFPFADRVGSPGAFELVTWAHSHGSAGSKVKPSRMAEVRGRSPDPEAGSRYTLPRRASRVTERASGSTSQYSRTPARP